MLTLILFLVSQAWPITLRIQKQVFSGRNVLPDSKKTKLGTGNQEASPSVGKNAGIVLVACLSWKCVATAISVGLDIFEVPGCHLTDEFSLRVTKIATMIGVSLTHILLSCFWHILTHCIMAIILKGLKWDNFEPHNSLKLSFTNIRGLHSNFVECESLLKSKSADILALWETNLDVSIDSGNFSVRGYLPLIREDSNTHMHSLAVYAKEGLPAITCTYLIFSYTHTPTFCWKTKSC